MGNRLELHEIFKSMTDNVYYNPPGKLNYPAIKYNISDVDVKRANNSLYNSTVCYSVTVISPSPNDETVKELLSLPMCKFNRHYTYDGLNHDVLQLYY